MSNRNSQARRDASRRNGAKSHGPTTPAGMLRSRTASYKHGIYAVRGHMLPGEAVVEMAELQDQLYAFWQPVGFHDQQLVEQLAANLWETSRLNGAKNDQVYEKVVSITRNSPHLLDQAKINLLAEAEVSVPGGTVLTLEARLNRLARERRALQAQLITMKKFAATSGPSQKSLKLNRRQHPEIPSSFDAAPTDGTLAESPYIVEATPEPLPESFDAQPIMPAADPQPQSITEWAATELNIEPDQVQTQIMTEENTRVMVLAPRQTGKSTAAAVRVLFEAIHHNDAAILLASASGRQSGQIMEKARKMARILDLELLPPPPKCDGFSLANGSQVIALPDSPETVRGFSAPRLIVVDEAAFASEELFKSLEPMLTVSNGTLMLLSTPNGQSGYFYDQWHTANSPWARIFGTLKDCPRVNHEAIENIRKTMSESDFQQEFECKFVASSGQFISNELFEKCLRDDVEIFDMDFDEEI